MTLRANSTAEKNGSRNTFYYWSTQNIISLSHTPLLLIKFIM